MQLLLLFVCLFNTYSVLVYAVMHIGWQAEIIGMNLSFRVTPPVGRVRKWKILHSNEQGFLSIDVTVALRRAHLIGYKKNPYS